MPYPTTSKAEARAYLVSLANGGTPALPDVHHNDDGPEHDWDSIGEEVSVALTKLLQLHDPAEGQAVAGRFEAAAAPVVHELLPDHPALANPEFWTWLALFHCQEVVAKRYPKAEKINQKNFGVGGSAENLLYRLWLRADIAFTEESSDQYGLARVGDIDFWRSHLFRQGYGDARVFALALLNFQFPEGEGGVARLRVEEIRELAKHLKRARSNLLFEVMSEARASQFIESEWDRLASL